VPPGDQLVKVGTTFSPELALASGMDDLEAFQRLEAMGFAVIRLAVSWDAVDSNGFGRLDRLVAEAERSGQQLVLSVGIKAPGWPEFHVPVRYSWATPGDLELRAAALAHVQRAVERYRANRIIVAWQLENEPLDAAGPRGWRLSRDFLLQEMTEVRHLDPRPIVLSAFGPIRRTCDHVSSVDGCDAGALAGADAVGSIPELLSLLGPQDVLGVDIYTGVGVSRAADCWPARAAGWLSLAVGTRRQVWVTELQAEPWEPTPATLDQPLSTSPARITADFATLRRLGFRQILLWGSDYWLRRSKQGDERWLQAVKALLKRRCQPAHHLAGG
jgi:Cellulase (glycosyl hydrolase family 5)